MLDTSETDIQMSPGDEVEALLQAARKVQNLDPTLQMIFHKHRELLLDVLSRQVNLLKTRSQALQDAQITVYDKVLLALTDDGNYLEHPAAITWYCSEYCGFNPDVAQDHNTNAIEQSLAFPVALSQASTNNANFSRLHPSDSKVVASPAPTIHDEHAGWSTKDEAVWQRFCDVYNRAVRDFNHVADERSSRTHEAARWLRDTAENGIHLLERLSNSNIDVAFIQDLKVTYNMAQRTVEEMTGGKKRKFDHYVDMKERSSSRYKEQSGGGRKDFNNETTGHGSTNAERELFPEGPKRRYSRYGHRYPPRGHSGVAYGYAERRLVDSYVPNRDGPLR